jgi:hypothetical protein
MVVEEVLDMALSGQVLVQHTLLMLLIVQGDSVEELLLAIVLVE